MTEGMIAVRLTRIEDNSSTISAIGHWDRCRKFDQSYLDSPVVHSFFCGPVERNLQSSTLEVAEALVVNQ